MMSAPQGFHDFWAIYPRRVAKQTAINSWSRQIGVDVKLTLLVIEAIRWQAAHVFAGRELEKIPHPATWLNQRRWEDERQAGVTNGAGGPHYPRLG